MTHLTRRDELEQFQRPGDAFRDVSVESVITGIRDEDPRFHSNTTLAQVCTRLVELCPSLRHKDMQFNYTKTRCETNVDGKEGNLVRQAISLMSSSGAWSYPRVVALTVSK